MNDSVKKTIKPLHLFYILFMVLGWAFNVTAVKVIVTGGMGPITAAAYRFTIALIFGLLFVRIAGINIKFQKGDISLYLPTGISFLAQIVLFNIASKYTDSSHVGVILNVYPFWVAVVSGFIFAEDKHTIKGIAGALVAVLGVVFIFKDSFYIKDSFLFGDFLCLLSSIVLAVGIVFQKRALRKKAEPLKVMIYPMFVSVLGYYLLAFILDDAPFTAGINSISILMLLFQGVVVGGVVFVLWQYMLREYNPSQLSSFFFLVPFFSVLFGVIILNEPVTSGLGIGLLLISSGIFFVNR